MRKQSKKPPSTATGDVFRGCLYPVEVKLSSFAGHFFIMCMHLKKKKKQKAWYLTQINKFLLEGKWAQAFCMQSLCSNVLICNRSSLHLSMPQNVFLSPFISWLHPVPNSTPRAMCVAALGEQKTGAGVSMPCLLLTNQLEPQSATEGVNWCQLGCFITSVGEYRLLPEIVCCGQLAVYPGCTWNDVKWLEALYSFPL